MALEKGPVRIDPKTYIYRRNIVYASTREIYLASTASLVEVQLNLKMNVLVDEGVTYFVKATQSCTGNSDIWNQFGMLQKFQPVLLLCVCKNLFTIIKNFY